LASAQDVHLAHELSTPGTDASGTRDALLEHEAALAWNEETAANQKRLLQDSEGSAARLLAMNALLRKDLDDALTAAASHPRTPEENYKRKMNNAATGGDSGSGEVTSLRAALVAERKKSLDLETQLKIVSAGFQLLKRERGEALRVLKDAENTRVALDAERAAVETLRLGWTPNRRGGNDAVDAFEASNASRYGQGERETKQGEYVGLPQKFNVGSKKSRSPSSGIEPTLSRGDSESAGLSAANGAAVSDDEAVFVGSDFSEDDFDFEVEVAGRGDCSLQPRPATARRVGLRHNDDVFRLRNNDNDDVPVRPTTAPSSRRVLGLGPLSPVASDGDETVSDDAREDTGDLRCDDLRHALHNGRDVPGGARKDTRRPGDPTPHRVRKEPSRYDTHTRRTARGDAPRLRSRNASRAASARATPGASPVKNQFQNQHQHQEKPEWRPAGIAKGYAAAHELLTGATLAAAAAALVARDANVARTSGQSFGGNPDSLSRCGRRKPSAEGNRNLGGVTGGDARRVLLPRNKGGGENRAAANVTCHRDR
tara:strand:- start:1922 stop:3547 length:1626 start_codon:yes stop_codon:yes gene_type:complete